MTDGKTEVLGGDRTCSRARSQQPIGLWPHVSAPPPPHLSEFSAGTGYLHIPVGSPTQAHLLLDCLLSSFPQNHLLIHSFIPSFIQLANQPTPHAQPHARPLAREMRASRREQRLLVSTHRGVPAVCQAARKVPETSGPALAVLMVLPARQGLYQDPIPRGKSWGKLHTLQPRFPHLSTGILRAASH